MPAKKKNITSFRITTKSGTSVMSMLAAPSSASTTRTPQTPVSPMSVGSSEMHPARATPGNSEAPSPALSPATVPAAQPTPTEHGAPAGLLHEDDFDMHGSNFAAHVLSMEEQLNAQAKEAAQQQPAQVYAFDEPEILKWMKMADEGVDVRSAAGQQFARKEGQTPAYKAMSTSEKANFRKEWAKGKYEELKVQRSKSRSWQRVDTSKGIYQPFSVIVKKEGNDNAAVKAAVNYVAACQKMGGAWQKYNTMTQRVEWLYMKAGMEEIFTESWRLYEEATQKQAAGIADGSPEDKNNKKAGSADKKAASGGEDAAGGGAGKGSKRTRGADDPEKPSPAPEEKRKTERTPFDAAVAAANLSKKNYIAIANKGNIVLGNIEQSDEWVWAKAKHKALLSDMMDDMNKLVSSDFAKKFLTIELRDLRQQYRQAELQIELETWTSCIDPMVTSMNKLITKILKMHAESMKD
jgi:hypothetical protein